MERLKLSHATVGPVARGHPWVYEDAVSHRPPVGTPVQLLDPKGRTVAFGLADEGQIAVRVLGRHAEPIGPLIAARIAAAAAARPRLVPPDTDAYRVVNGAGDRLPGVVVDRYGALAVLRLYGACWVPHLDALADAVAAIPGVDQVARRLGVRRVDADDGLVPLRGGPPPDTLVVHEAGLKFLVRPAVGQKTGLFLDQREHRIFVGARARDLEVVNLFGYTGGFSVHAAAAGARRVITVDLAPEAIADAKENFRLNGLDPDAHGFEVADVFDWVDGADAGLELLIVDPPSLSRGQRSDHAAQRAYRDLNQASGRLVAPGGLLASASCTARLSRDRWEQAVREGLRKAGRWAWLWRADEPPDHPVAVEHPEGRYLKFGLLRRMG